MDRWEEYNGGKLTTPAVVQHDIVGAEHLIWVCVDGKTIIGPLSRAEYDEAGVVSDAIQIASEIVVPAPYTEDIKITALTETIATLTAENTTLKATNTILIAEKADLEKTIADAVAIKTVK